jgi:hypothetical protein
LVDERLAEVALPGAGGSGLVEAGPIAPGKSLSLSTNPT